MSDNKSNRKARLKSTSGKFHIFTGNFAWLEQACASIPQEDAWRLARQGVYVRVTLGRLPGVPAQVLHCWVPKGVWVDDQRSLRVEKLKADLIRIDAELKAMGEEI